MKKTFKKTLAILLSMILFLTAFASTAFAAIDASLLFGDRIITSEKEYRLVSGVVERDFVLNNKSKTEQINCFVMEVDLNNPDVSVIAAYNDGDADEWARIPVRDQAMAMENKKGVNVIGAVNGDFHNTTTGEPSGVLVMDSSILHTSSSRAFFAILKNGTAVIRNAGGKTSDVAEAVGGRHRLVRDRQNVAPSDGLAPRTAIGIKADGSIVMLVVDGRQAPSSCGMDLPEVAATMLALGCVDALELDGGGSATLLAQREASSDLECRNSPSYGYERKVASSLLVCTTAKPTGVFDHVAFSETTYLCAPYSSVSISAKGVDINGYTTDLPAGGSLVLADKDYGRFDGKKFISNGKVGTTVINYVVNGEVIASSIIEITEDADNAIEAFFRQIVQFFANIINSFKLIIEKVFGQA